MLRISYRKICYQCIAGKKNQEHKMYITKYEQIESASQQTTKVKYYKLLMHKIQVNK